MRLGLGSEASPMDIAPAAGKSKAFSKYQDNIELVKKCVSTIENEFARRMNNYKGLKKACPNFLTNYD